MSRYYDSASPVPSPSQSLSVEPQPLISDCKTALAESNQDSLSMSLSESDLALSVPLSPPTSRPPSPAMSIIEEDQEFFMESTFVVIQVQRCHFRIPTYLLEKESQVFHKMFNLPSSTEPEQAGSSVFNPIILPEKYLKEDFRNFLKALYPTSFTPKLILSKSEWLSVLKLSTEWHFLNLRSTAIYELALDREHPTSVGADSNSQAHSGWLTSVEKITYGRKYHISSWITTGFFDLITRKEPLSNDEALAISAGSPYLTTPFALFRLREARLRDQLAASELSQTQIQDRMPTSVFGSAFGNSVPMGAKPNASPVVDVKAEVELAFEEELAGVRADEDAFVFRVGGRDEQEEVQEEVILKFECPRPPSPPPFVPVSVPNPFLQLGGEEVLVTPVSNQLQEEAASVDVSKLRGIKKKKFLKKMKQSISTVVPASPEE